MIKRVENLLKFFVILTFTTPWLVFVKSFIFPFIVPKVVGFRILVLLLLGCYILLLYLDWQRYRPRLTALNITVLLFYVSFLVSTFVGVDWYRSLWDNHERMLGAFTLTHYILYYFILVSVFREWKDWKMLLRLFLGAGTIVMFIGFLQRFGNKQILMNQGERVYGTLGNPIYFSGYGLFLFFIGYLLAIKEKGQQKIVELSGMRAFWFWFAVVGGLLGFWGVFGGNTRGAFLGLIIGIGVLLVSYVFSLQKNKKAKQTMVGLIILGLVLLAGLFAFRQTNFVSSLPAVGRLVNTDLSSSNTRFMAWGVAIDAWQEKPIFGWGPNNYYYAFNKYYRAEFLEHGWGETWFDNAHSVIMNTLATQGIVGILLYLNIFLVVVLTLWKKHRKDGENIDIHILAVGSAFLVAHLVSLTTVFENPTSYLYFFFFLAYVGSQVFKEKGEINNKKVNIKSWPIGFSVISGLVILLLIYSTNINAVRANTTTLKSIRALNMGKISEGISLFEEAKNYPSPHIDDIRNDFTRVANQDLLNLYQKGGQKEAEEIYTLSIAELKENLRLHPLDIRIHIQLAQIYQNVATIEQDVSYLLEGESFLEQALQISPKRQQIMFLLANFKFLLNKTDEGIALLERVLQDDKNIGGNWVRLAGAYVQYEKIEKAQKLLQEIEESDVNFKDQELQTLSNIYNRLNIQEEIQ